MRQGGISGMRWGGLRTWRGRKLLLECRRGSIEKGEEEKDLVLRCRSLRSNYHCLDFVRSQFACFILYFRQTRDSSRVSSIPKDIDSPRNLTPTTQVFSAGTRRVPVRAPRCWKLRPRIASRSRFRTDRRVKHCWLSGTRRVARHITIFCLTFSCCSPLGIIIPIHKRLQQHR